MSGLEKVLPLFTVIIVQTWRQLTSPSTEEWKNALRYIHIKKHYAVVTESRGLTHVKMWVNLTDVYVKGQKNKNKVVYNYIHIKLKNI